MSHTPGPWSSSDYFVIRADAGFGPSVCTVSTGTIHGPFDDAVIKANANLIAAAPDLLAAINELRIDANRLCDRQLGGTYEEDCRRSLARADAAIAKAEGRL